MINVTSFKPQLVGEGEVETFIYNNDAVALEPKIDGIRILLEKNGTEIKLITRNGKDYSSRYKSIAEDLRKGILPERIILDGEMAVLKKGKVAGSHRAIAKELFSDERFVFFVFDILEVDGNSLIESDYVTRRQHINFFVQENDGLNIVPNTFTNTIVDVERLYKKLIESGFEGIVIKNLESYKPNSRFNWIKMKPIRTIDVKIIEKKQTKDNKAWVYKYISENEKTGTVMSSADYSIGSTIELSFNKGDFEKLRFPRIIRVREDK